MPNILPSQKQNTIQKSTDLSILNSTTPTIITDRKGNITHVNTPFCTQTNYITHELIGKNLWNIGIIPVKDQKKLQNKSFSQIFTTQNKTTTINITSKNGLSKTINITTQPLIKNGKTIGKIFTLDNKEHPPQTSTQKKPTQLKTNQTNSNNSTSELIGEVRKKSTEINKLVSVLEEKIKNLDIDKKQLKDTREKIKERRQELETHKIEIQKLQANLEWMQHQITAKNIENENLKQENSVMQAQLEEKNTKIHLLESELNRKTLSFEFTNNQLQTTLKDLKCTQIKIDQNIEEIKTLQDTLNEKQHELSSIMQDLEIRNELIDQLKNQLDQQQVSTVVNSAVHNQIKQDNTHLTDCLEQKMTELQTIRHELEHKHEEINQLQLDMATRNKIIQNISEQLHQKHESHIANRLKIDENLHEPQNHNFFNKPATELQNVLQEIESLKQAVEVRNQIIDNLNAQINENQMRLLHHEVIQNKPKSPMSVHMTDKIHQNRDSSNLNEHLELSNKFREDFEKWFNTQKDLIPNNEAEKLLMKTQQPPEGDTSVKHDISSINNIVKEQSQPQDEKTFSGIEENSVSESDEFFKLIDSIDRCLELTDKSLQTKKLQDEDL